MWRLSGASVNTRHVILATCRVIHNNSRRSGSRTRTLRLWSPSCYHIQQRFAIPEACSTTACHQGLLSSYSSSEACPYCVLCCAVLWLLAGVSAAAGAAWHFAQQLRVLPAVLTDNHQSACASDSSSHRQALEYVNVHFVVQAHKSTQLQASCCSCQCSGQVFLGIGPICRSHPAEVDADAAQKWGILAKPCCRDLLGCAEGDKPRALGIDDAVELLAAAQQLADAVMFIDESWVVQ